MQSGQAKTGKGPPMSACLILPLLYLVNLAMIGWWMVHAPVAEEDENGFHPGTQRSNYGPGGSSPSGLFVFHNRAIKGPSMNQSEISVDVEAEQPETAPAPEGFVPCKVCGDILGYYAHDEGALFTFAYAYPPHGPCADLAGRRVNAGILSGKLYCRRCGNIQWVEIPRKWER
jgi:hypothetical protein